jgi:hypothetical protein
MPPGVCPGPQSKVPVPGSRDNVAKAAEAYFFERLTTRYRSLGYECFSEFGYADASTFRRWARLIRHRRRDLDRVLGLLYDHADAIGKPDFIAVKAYHGVVAEVGTVDDRSDKQRQLNRRLRVLTGVSDTYERTALPGAGGRQAPRWEAAGYRPPVGPVTFDCGAYLICTAPTWASPRPPAGVLLYEVHRRAGDGDRVPVPSTAASQRNLRTSSESPSETPPPSASRRPPPPPGTCWTASRRSARTSPA